MAEQVTPGDSLQDDLRAYAKECEGSIYIPAELARVVADRLDALESRVSPVTRGALSPLRKLVEAYRHLRLDTPEDQALHDRLTELADRALDAVLSVSPPAESKEDAEARYWAGSGCEEDDRG